MSATAQHAFAGVSSSLRLALATIGFTSVIAQIILMRELFVSSYGNELSLGLTLALWLLWTSFGSAVLGRLFRRTSSTRLLAFLQIAIAVVLFISILLVRSSRSWWNAAPGEVLGPLPILLTALVALGLLCPISGWLFAAGARAYAESSKSTIAEGGTSTYLYEALGSAIGGVLASTTLIRFFDGLQIAIIIAIMNFVVAASLAITNRTVRRFIVSLSIVAGAFAVPTMKTLELRSVSQSWPGFHALATRNSRYGSLSVIGTNGNRSVIQNGLVLFTVPDQYSAEEAVHFPLLEHPQPRSVLLIGGGLNGSLAEILKYPSVAQVDYVELDPEVLRIAQDQLPQDWAKFATDSRVHVHHIDGRLFLRSTGQRYDVVILNLPEPHTAQLNRFYTEEFFREVRNELAQDGVFGFQLHGAEEYISPDLAQFLRCIDLTLKQVFPEVTAIPGENVHFLASLRRGTLTTDPQLLLQRLNQRGIQTTYVREYYLPFRMAPERITGLHDQLAAAGDARLNRDFTPIAYYFDVALWGSQFSARYRDIFLTAAAIRFRTIVLVLVALVVLLTGVLTGMVNPAQRMASSAGLAVMVAGLTLMGTEVLLLLGFQAIYGYVFDELAAIVAGFMAGMALGSWYARRSNRRMSVQIQTADLRRLLLLQIAVTLLPLAVMAALAGTSGLRGTLLSVAAHAGFPAIAILCGLIGGYQFPIAIRLFAAAKTGSASSAGMLYGLDLVGAALGAALITIYVLPVFGFLGGAELLILMNIGPMVVVTLTLARLSASHARY